MKCFAEIVAASLFALWTAAASADAPSVAAGQSWIYRDPPKAFGSVLHIVEIRTSARCAPIAHIRVLDIDDHSKYAQLWVPVHAVVQSVVSPSDGPNGSAGQVGIDRAPDVADCDDVSVSERLRVLDRLRKLECDFEGT